ncbi:hypothetical protein ACJRO7_009595 [Eucalyptus globulus]|uniref:Late embryogenesis abundant protein LEA-2 subgroup domain-containing protein n=1 Tax=Eucalyptus globulus TaxID=34317 RepID=A0ABD3LJ87_EUCGL
MASLPAISPAANDKPPSPSPVPAPLPPDGHKTIISHGIVFAVPILLGFLMFIFLGIPAVMLPEFKLDLGSSLSSPNISTSHVTARWNIAISVKNPSKLIAVKYTHMKLLLSFGGELSLSRPPQLDNSASPGPSMLPIVNGLSIKGLMRSLQSGMVTIDVVVKAKRRLHLGQWLWVPVFDVYFSCTDVTFTAPNNSKDGSDWMILVGTLHCEPNIFTLLW